MSPSPVFSLVVATYNAASLLERTLSSIVRQTCPRWEILVQDGGSTDGTLDILRRYADHISLESGPDAGIYDAWNKAVRRASGQWSLFLGADDFLVNEHVLDHCRRGLDALNGEIIFAYGALAMGRKRRVERILNRSRFNVFSMFLMDMGLPFPATFCRTSFLKQHAFDTRYRIAGDFDFCAQHVSLANVARLPLCVSFFEMGGMSDNPKTRRALLEERVRILQTRVTPRLASFHEAICATRPHDRAERTLLGLGPANAVS